MNYLKWLFRNRFEMVMAILSAIAFIGGIIAAVIVHHNTEKQLETDIDTHITNQAVVLAAKPIITEPIKETRVYFDVPLSHEVQDRIFDECEKHNIKPAIVIAMIQKESNFNTYALGDDGRSGGLMQIQAKWHLQRMINLDCTDLFKPCQNVTVGIDILAELYNKYDCDYGKVLTAYNKGHYSGTVTNYAKDIISNAKIIENERGNV